MDDFEKKVLEQATHKPVCWLWYVDDIFVIWPHGREKLTKFLNHVNGFHTNIQFTMEKEEGHLPFLDNDIYKKKESSATFHSWTLTSTRKRRVPQVTESIKWSLIPIFIDTGIPNTILQMNNQSWPPWYRAKERCGEDSLNPSAWGHLNPSSYCDVGRLFNGVFKLWSKLQRKKWRNNF